MLRQWLLAVVALRWLEGAQASNWIEIGSGPHVTLRLDTTSKVKVAKYQKAWVSYLFDEPQDGLPQTQFHPFTRDVELTYVDCAADTSASIQSSYFNGEKFVGGTNVTLTRAQFMESLPDTLGRAVIDYVCGRRKAASTQATPPHLPKPPIGVKFAIEPVYAYARDFSDGLAAVKSGDKWGFVDTRGRLVIPAEFNEGDPQFNARFSDGLCSVRFGNRWGFIDKTGAIALNPIYIADMYNPPSFSHGLAAVVTSSHLGYINTAGKMVIEPKYSSAGAFNERGYALVTLADAPITDPAKVADAAASPDSFWIDRSGTPVDAVTAMYDPTEKLIPFEAGGKYGYKDRSGAIVVPAQFDGADELEEGMGAVEKDKKYGFVNEDGDLAIPIQFDSHDTFISFTRGFSNGRAAVLYPTDAEPDPEKPGLVFRKGKWGYVDKAGHLVIKPAWDNAEKFSNGLAAVTLDKVGCGYIDKTGRVVVPPQFGECGEFLDGMARVGLQAFVGPYGWIRRP